MLAVALFVYLLTGLILRDPCPKRIYNNFFSALFHDLPEVYTRDIISPIKREIPGLDTVILEYEQIKIEEKILPLLPENWHFELLYFLNNQFDDRIAEDGEIKVLEHIDDRFNEDCFSPADGRLVKVADEMAAFWEAGLSLAHGIRSPNLLEAVSSLEKKYRGHDGLQDLYDSKNLPQ
jgi:putative hydrolase of HD superfamily